jgi:hypothetical protein
MRTVGTGYYLVFLNNWARALPFALAAITWTLSVLLSDRVAVAAGDIPTKTFVETAATGCTEQRLALPNPISPMRWLGEDVTGVAKYSNHLLATE